MKKIQHLIIIASLSLFIACSGNGLEKKGFSVLPLPEAPAGVNEETSTALEIKTRPSNVLLTGNPTYRLTTIYKVNYNKKTKKTFIGSNAFHYNYSDDNSQLGNRWNYHYMPGLEAVYGYNLLNISHYNIETKKQKPLFKTPVLIKTLYYPSFEQDTLYHEAVNRNYFLISVYDEDTNGDTLINVKDLRRFYHFDIEGKTKTPLIPLNYSVLRSEYDPANDYMYIFAKIDKNENGKRDEEEDLHIFWIDLKDPKNNGRQY